MELETQVQVSTNQLRRQDEEARLLRENLDAALQRERALQTRQREFQHKYADLESKVNSHSSCIIELGMSIVVAHHSYGLGLPVFFFSL